MLTPHKQIFKILQADYTLRKKAKVPTHKLAQNPDGEAVMWPKTGDAIVLADSDNWLWPGMPDFSVGTVGGRLRPRYQPGDTLSVYFTGKATLQANECTVSGIFGSKSIPVECFRYTGLELLAEFEEIVDGRKRKVEYWVSLFELYRSPLDAELKPTISSQDCYQKAQSRGFRLEPTLEVFSGSELEGGQEQGDVTFQTVGVYASPVPVGKTYQSLLLDAFIFQRAGTGEVRYLRRRVQARGADHAPLTEHEYARLLQDRTTVGMNLTFIPAYQNEPA